jgi:hypothetical protein
MAEHDQKGTGKHPHKSTEEPYSHTKEEKGQHESKGHQSGSHESGSRESGGHSEHTKTRAAGHSTSQSEDAKKEEDLKRREYRDKEGNIHHHTHTAGKKEDEK